MRIKAPSVKAIEKAIGVPAREWPGRCHEIASAVVESGLVKGTAVYGHFLGSVDPRSKLYRPGAPFYRHGWIVIPKWGPIVDPTRWVFEAVEPYVWVGPADGDYDEGGERLRKATRRPPPKFDSSADRIYEIKNDAVSPEVRAFLTGALGAEINLLTASQLGWLANLPLDSLKPHALEIYALIDSLGLRGFVPWDNRKRVEEGRE
jgi:hypothetical protein